MNLAGLFCVVFGLSDSPVRSFLFSGRPKRAPVPFLLPAYFTSRPLPGTTIYDGVEGRLQLELAHANKFSPSPRCEEEWDRARREWKEE